MTKWRILMKLSFFATTVAVLILANTGILMAHCEIPCGIYGDSTRFTLLKEHIATMEKSINQIEELSKTTPSNPNQLYRWVMNKEEHADKFGDIITQYFMRQRIHPAKTAGKLGNYDPEYVQKLVLLHELYVYSMKVKQSTDKSNIETLKMVLKRFETLYSHKH